MLVLGCKIDELIWEKRDEKKLKNNLNIKNFILKL